MKIVDTNISGLKILEPRVFEDIRGKFIKTFTNDFLPLKPYQFVGVWNEKGYIEEQKCVRIRE